MKVTVCFGPVKVIVPCGEGDLTIQELIDRSVSRYRKATNKNTLDYVNVRSLETIEDNAILDADDLVSDVCDDRDKLIAIFDERIRHRPPNNGDGTSASSAGTASPDIFQGGTYDESYRLQPVASLHDSDAEKPAFVNGSINRKNVKDIRIEQEGMENFKKDKRWKSTELDFRNIEHEDTIGGLQKQRHSTSTSSTNSSPDISKKPRALGVGGFDRNLNRKSLNVNHPMLYSWIDAQDRMMDVKYSQRKASLSDREEPAGSSISPSHEDYRDGSVISGDRDESDDKSSTSEEIELDNRENKDVGFQVKGYKTADGRELGLIVYDIKQDITKYREGSLQVADRITEINGTNLRDMPNDDAEKLFMEALKAPSLRFKRTRSHRFVKGSSIRKSNEKKFSAMPKIPESVLANSREAPKPKENVEQMETHEAPIEDPTVKIQRSRQPQKGTKITLELTKGKEGLGFSITSRDVLTGAPSPVYVKNILNKGAAIQDGRLRTGDQLLQVNDIPVLGKNQSEVVKILRSTSGTVKLVVFREGAEEENNEPDIQPASNDQPSSPDGPSPQQPDDILTLTIPLTSTGAAGLGISVKGKTSGGDSAEDLGIYVKSVIPGGAAAKDGRLQPDDQLLVLDNTSLVGISNSDAMEVLRAALQNAVKQGSIKIIISRKAHGSVESPRQSLSEPVDIIRTDKEQEVPSVEDIDRKFDELYLKKHYSPSKSPTRNQSFFRAVVDKERSVPASGTQSNEVTKEKDRRRDSKTNDQIVPSEKQTRKKSRSSSSSSIESKDAVPRSVSVSSTEIPLKQTSKPVIIDKNNDSPGSGKKHIVRASILPKDTVMFFDKSQLPNVPPSYEEAMQRVGSISEKISKTLDSGKRLTSVSSNNHPLLDPEEQELLRTMSVSSQWSVDSLMISPDKIPFQRDAFGRLSMSERKGRAHLDATKSDFYSKMKKFKSMEDISFGRTDDPPLCPASPSRNSLSSDDNGIIPFHEGLRRTESADTILSSRLSPKPDEAAVPSFSRGTKITSSTPWYVQRPATDALRQRFPASSPPQLRVKDKSRRARPVSCHIEPDQFSRSRSSAWQNDSFRNAVDKTPVFYTEADGDKQGKPANTRTKDNLLTVPITMTSNAQYVIQKEKKKSGFLKGIGQFLKKSKPKKPEEQPLSTQTLNRRREKPRQEEALLEVDAGRRRRPKSLHEEALRAAQLQMTVLQENERLVKDKEQKLKILQQELQQAKTGDSKGEDISTSSKSQDRDNRERKVKRQDLKQELKNSPVISNPNATDSAELSPPALPVQKRLRTSDLFYYGHNSLPRHFTLQGSKLTNKNKEENSVPKSKPTSPSTNPTSPSTEPTSPSTEPTSQSIKPSSPSTEPFKRAVEEKPSKDYYDIRRSNRERTSKQRINKMVRSGGITISHTAKV